jgi:HK97 family phage portal protein
MIARALSAILPGRSSSNDYTLDPLSNFAYNPIATRSASGVNVNDLVAMSNAAVYACVRVLRETIGSLPFHVYRQVDDRTKEKDRNYYLWRVLHDRPNDWQTPQEWKEMGVTHLCLRGNFFCAIHGVGKAMQLEPLEPDRMKVEQLENRQLKYTYRKKDGGEHNYRPSDIFHVRGMTLDGIVGLSVLSYARNAIGLAVAQETHGAALFRNGGLPAFWISRPAGRKWTDGARRNFRQGWRKLHGGAENAGNPPIMEDDMEIHELGMTNRDTQWIESAGLSAQDICRFFGVWPEMIGADSGTVAETVEQRSIQFKTYTLRPLAKRFEESADRDLVMDHPNHFTKLNLGALMAGDEKSQAEADNIKIQGGLRKVNELRERDDLNPVDGGDITRFPMNMQPAGGDPDRNEQGGIPGKGTPKPKQPKPVQDDPTAYEKRRQKKTTEVFGVLLDEAADRIASSEISGLNARADKASSDRERWSNWVSETRVKHRSYCEKVLYPICLAWEEETEEAISPIEIGMELSGWKLDMVHDSDDVPGLLSGWRETRAAELAGVLREIFFHEKL